MTGPQPEPSELPDRVRLLLCRVCHDSTMLRVVDPVTADWQHETGGTSSRSWDRFIVNVRWVRALFSALALDWATRPHGDAETRSNRAVLSTAAVAWTVMTVAQLLAFAGTLGWERRLFFVLPAIQTLSLPVAVFFAALSGDRRPASSWRTMVISVSAACLMAFLLLTVVPVANQAFRAATWQAAGGVAAPALGPNEHTFARLRDEETRLRLSGDPRTAGLLAAARHTRIALPAICLAFGWLGGAVASAGWWRSRSKVILGGFTSLMLAYVIMMVGRDLVRSDLVTPWFGVWLPVLVTANAAFCVQVAVRRRRV